MASRIIHSCARGVRGIDIPAAARPALEAVPEPSRDLLDRALIGWERFTGVAEEPTDE